MHSCSGKPRIVTNFLIISVMALLVWACGSKDIDKRITAGDGTWQLDKYQVFRKAGNPAYNTNYEGAKLFRNYEELGKIQFNDDNTALFTYDTIAVPMKWQQRFYENFDVGGSWDVLDLTVVDSPSATAMRIPFIRHNIKDSVSSFKVISNHRKFLYLRYRFQDNDHFQNRDTFNVVDLYLSRN